MSWLNPDTKNQVLPAKVTINIKRGDILRHELAGAGGWGDPLDRDPAAVLRDVRNELVSVEAAAKSYGVVVDTDAWVVDRQATDAYRADMRAARGWTDVPTVLWDGNADVT